MAPGCMEKLGTCGSNPLGVLELFIILFIYGIYLFIFLNVRHGKPM